MKKLTALLITLAVLGTTMPAFAQSQKSDVPEQFINIEEMLIDGDLVAPEIQRVEPHNQAKFERLSKLKRSFVSKITDSTNNRSLQ